MYLDQRKRDVIRLERKLWVYKRLDNGNWQNQGLRRRLMVLPVKSQRLNIDAA
ncbi:MAG: hypothetical protein WBM04_04460 [Candidatus Korobacteraceae bacterium]